jgi:beta-N-acetylglucosaminidase
LCAKEKVKTYSSKEAKKLRNKKWREVNIARSRELNNNWAKNNKNKLKDLALKKAYGISLDEYNSILLAQSGKCKICKKHYSEFTIALAVDHCHNTGKIRGLLCDSCNRGLGYFKDSRDLLLEASNYLS